MFRFLKFTSCVTHNVMRNIHWRRIAEKMQSSANVEISPVHAYYMCVEDAMVSCRTRTESANWKDILACRREYSIHYLASVEAIMHHILRYSVLLYWPSSNAFYIYSFWRMILVIFSTTFKLMSFSHWYLQFLRSIPDARRYRGDI